MLFKCFRCENYKHVRFYMARNENDFNRVCSDCLGNPLWTWLINNVPDVMISYLFMSLSISIIKELAQNAMIVDLLRNARIASCFYLIWDFVFIESNLQQSSAEYQHKHNHTTCSYCKLSLLWHCFFPNGISCQRMW